jgi:hypothetical protein
MFLPLLAVVRVVYAQGPTGEELAADINQKIASLEQSIDPSEQELNILDVKMIPEKGEAFVFYEILKESYVSDWSSAELDGGEEPSAGD